MRIASARIRLLSGICALVIVVGLILQWRSVGLLLESQGTGFLAKSFQFLAWFTVVTNLFCLGYCIRVFAKASMPNGRLMAVPCAAIITVFLVAAFVLKSPGDLRGLARYADILLHYGSPPLFSLLWWLCRDSETRTVPWVAGAGYPMTYAAWIFLRGGLTGYYPYPFVDPAVRGVMSAAVHVLVMFGLYAAVLAILLIASTGTSNLKPPNAERH
ncbi:MAG: Pr6Pr family membrane protein [Planctomycetaceae bacterium]|nr:Pr6Pr family membrane protein [Planctomycetaceae bacterium]